MRHASDNPSPPLITSTRLPYGTGSARAAALKSTVAVGLTVCLILGLSACAAGSAEARQSLDGGPLAQFLLGLWHGVIAPAVLVLEIVNRLAPHLLPWSARFYEIRGTLVEYDVGFYLGLTGSPLFAWTRWTSRRRIVD